MSDDGRQRTADEGRAEVRRRYPGHVGPDARYRTALQDLEEEQPLLPHGFRADSSEYESVRIARRREHHARYDL